MEKIIIPVNRPFEHITEDTWNFLAEWSPSHEYTELDDIYAIIDGTRENESNMSLDELKKDYEVRFPKMFAQALANYSRAILNEAVQFRIDFDRFA